MPAKLQTPSTYFAAHRETVENALARAVRQTFEECPADPLTFLGNLLCSESAIRADDTIPLNSHGSSEGVWTVAGWLASEDLTGSVANAINVPAASTSPLAFVQGELTYDMLYEQLRDAHLGGLCDIVWAAVLRLRAAAAPTAELLQDKFVQDGAGVLSYSSLHTFFGGLEGVVGGPSPNFVHAMHAEHTERGDSHESFSTSNYGVKTCSSTEWRFVAEPDAPPEGGWPTEEKLAAASDARAMAHGRSKSTKKLIEAGARPRRPLPLDELHAIIDLCNTRLGLMKEPSLILVEAMAARLYTGPLFPKYNAVLRGLETPVVALRNEMIKRCCATDAIAQYESGALTYCEMRGSHLNTYTTTIHAINSSIVKLSKLTVATTVYRGVHKLVLPKEFWTANAVGVMGGIEPAFMSTTTSRDVAMSYAATGGGATGGGAGFLLEIRQGMVDRGADLSALSQYPHEKEILFNPLVGLEVHSTRVEGAVMIVSVGLSVNLTSLTIEQVIGRRKKVLEDMVPGLEAEVKAALRAEGIATAEGVERLATWMKEAVNSQALSRGAEWYNLDEHFLVALQIMLKTRRGYSSGSAQRAEQLARLDADQIRQLGFPSEAFAAEVVISLQRLEDASSSVRLTAVERLGKLGTALLKQHADAIFAMLDDTDESVRLAAVTVLAKLGPVSAQRAREAVSAVYTAQLEHSDLHVREAALEAIGNLGAVAVSQHSAVIIHTLKDESSAVRSAAVDTLGLDAATLMQHAAVIVAMLEDVDQSVRTSALETLGKLNPASLDQHSAAIAARLGDTSEGVRNEALETLSKLDAAALSQHAYAVVAKLEDSDFAVRSAALETLAKLDPGVLSQHAGAVVAKLKDEDEGVREVAVTTLRKLDADVLAQHADDLRAMLKDKDEDVRAAAAEALRKLR